MMLRGFCGLFGVLFLAYGIMGFFPGLLEENKLFGILRINLEHNVANIAAGLLAIFAASSSKFAAKTYFIVGGGAFALVSFYGFLEKEELLFHLIAVNRAGNILHAVLAAIFLFLGLSAKRGNAETVE